MKKSLIGVLGALMVVAFLAPGVMAFNLTMAPGYGPHQTLQGGEFSVSTDVSFLQNYVALVTKDLPGYTGFFQTFCLEKSETISPGTYTGILSDSAKLGGVGGGGSADPISVGTAWLYDQFAAGVLSGYDYLTGGRSKEVGDSADLLQQTIWWLEQETIDPGIGNTFRQAVLAKFGSEANAKANNAGTYRVMVINVTDANGGLHQDMLVKVPEPATLLLLGFGLIGLTVVGGRKFIK